MAKKQQAPIAFTIGGRAHNITTAFQQRMLDEFRRLRRDQTWSVLAAESGAGKTRAVMRAVADAGGVKVPGETRQPIVVARIPKAGPRRADNLVAELLADTGQLEITKPAARRRALVSHLAKAGTELVIVDDFHEASLEQCDVLREIEDQLEVPVGFALLAALATPDPTMSDPLAMLNRHVERARKLDEAGRQDEKAQDERIRAVQFLRRLEDGTPCVLVPGHSADETADILATFDLAYADRFPGLELEAFADQIFEGVLGPTIDWLGMGTARMNAIVGVVRRALARLARGDARALTEQLVADAIADYADRAHHFVTAGEKPPKPPRAKPRAPGKGGRRAA